MPAIICNGPRVEFDDDIVGGGVFSGLLSVCKFGLLSSLIVGGPSVCDMSFLFLSGSPSLTEALSSEILDGKNDARISAYLCCGLEVSDAGLLISVFMQVLAGSLK